MSTNSRSGALVAGLVLIGLGLIFFLQNVYGYSAWSLIYQYWPVILILIGLRKLYLYFSWRDTPQEPAPKKEQENVPST